MEEIDLSGRTLLLTNDDGIDGAGLLALAARLGAAGADVCVLAPDSNRSGVSSLLTMSGALTFRRVRGRGPGEWYSCSGSPVDCVISALLSPIFGGRRFGAVVSGINRGANLGTDAVYSGTCAAARQAVLYGVPGIALSVESYDGSWRFGAMAEFCAANLGRLISLCTEELFVSVNGRSADTYNGVGFASLSVRDYGDRVSLLPDPNGDGDLLYGFFAGGEIRSSARAGASSEDDCSMSRRGLVSVSRLFAEPSAADDGGLQF